MGDNTYNGWTNRESWLVPLWYDNDEPLYTLRLDAVKLALRQTFPVESLARWLKNRVENHTPTVSQPYLKFLRIALTRVNYLEIAHSWLLDEWLQNKSLNIEPDAVFLQVVPDLRTEATEAIYAYFNSMPKNEVWFREIQKLDRLGQEQALVKLVEETLRPKTLYGPHLYTDLVDGVIAYIDYWSIIDRLTADYTKLLTD